MSRNGEAGNERGKAAAWVWYQRGASSSCAVQQSSSRNEAEEILACRRITSPQPSRFKREAAAAHYDHHCLQATPPHPAAPDHDHQHVDHSHPAAASAATTHALQNPIVRRSPQRSPSACRKCLLSPTSPSTQPAALHHCAHCGGRRKSESLPPVCNRWTNKLFGVSGRKSFSSLHGGFDSLSSVCSTNVELDSPISLAGSFSGRLNGDATAAVATFHSPNCMTSLLDSFELHAILKKLGYEADDDDLEEPALRSLGKETRQLELGNDRQDFSSSPTHCSQSLHDLLGWSERGLNKKGCSCTSEEEDYTSDQYYDVESPEINIGGCSSSNCSAKAAGKGRQRRRRRPSILMPHLPHSFSNALHHMHLPHSFSNALHHLPHSISSALHHLPNLPHSFSNALHQIAHLTHSLSSAYRNLHTASHRQNANNGGAYRSDIDIEASPQHRTHAHRHLIPPHIRRLLSFKTHHSPPHPSCSPAFDSVSQAANCHINTGAPALVQHRLKFSPSFNRHLSKSDDYMLIYNSAKKDSNHGSVHHHHHHHYHHHHYVF